MLALRTIAGTIFSVFVLMGGAAQGLVYWPADYNDLAGADMEGPEEGCMARINNGITKPSSTVIAPNFIITVSHWGNLAGRKVSVGSVDSDDYIIIDGRSGSMSPDLAVYKVKKLEWEDPNDPNDPNNPNPNDYDRLKDADFSDWVDLYSGSEELGRIVSIGCYGPQRLAERRGYDKGADPEVDAGSLHWGRNVVWNKPMFIFFSSIGEDDYVKYEAGGGDGDSGGPWFIKDGIEWKLSSLNAGVTTTDYWATTAGPRISNWKDWIDGQIEDMSGNRPLPDFVDIHWIGLDNGNWSSASNWDANRVPNLSDRAAIDNNTTAVISSGQVEAKELFIGIDNGGNLSQTGGTLAVEEYLYIGGRAECNSGSYVINEGSVAAKGIVIGSKGDGKLDIDDSDSEIRTRNLLFGENSELEAVSGSSVRMILEDDFVSYEYKVDGRIEIDTNADASSLVGLGNLTVVCGFEDINKYDPDIILVMEAAGGDDGDGAGPDEFSTNNFVIDKLTAGLGVNDVNSSAGRISVKLEDRHNNQKMSNPVVYEAIYANTLELKAGATFEVDPWTGNPHCNLYYKNGGAPKLFFMGDVNLDGVVDQNDLDIWAAHANDTGAEWSAGDMNGDRVVNAEDKLIIEKALKRAKNPRPANGIRVMRQTPLQLEWDAAADAESHNVYFGINYDAVANATEASLEFKGNQTGTIFEPDKPGMATHYWRIDEVDANGDTTKGYVWRFNYVLEDRVRNVTQDITYDWIQGAITDACDGDVIEVNEGSHYAWLSFEGMVYGNIRFDGKAITLRSADPNDWDVIANTVIDGGNRTTGAAVEFRDSEDADSVIKGLTIRNANKGIFCGDVADGAADPTITRCIITKNETGIYCEDLSNSRPTIINNIIAANRNLGIGVSRSAPIIRNNLIYGMVNEDPDKGSAIAISFPIAGGIIQNNTIVGNNWGIWVVEGDEPNVADPDIVNCIIWGNEYDDLWRDKDTLGATYSCIEDVGSAGGAGNITGNPLFVDFNSGDYHLGRRSPCIDSGDPSGDYGGQIDIDGEPRVIGPGIDMGADEWDYRISHWKFDEGSGSTAYDLVGENDGNIYGATWTAGKNEGALDFDGSGNYVEISNEQNFDFGSGADFTICAWVKTTAITDRRRIVDKSEGGYTPSTGFVLSMDTPAGVVSFGLKDDVNNSEVKTTTVINDSFWHFVAGVADRDGDLEIYHDGILEDTTSLAFVGDINNDIPVAVGRGMNYDGQYFDGIIDNVRIYGKALSAGEIRQVYRKEAGEKVFNPSPPDGDTDVWKRVILKWKAGVDTKWHNVYFGTSEADVNSATTASSEYKDRLNLGTELYDAGGNENPLVGEQYFWRIDEVNTITAKGSIWNFTVAGYLLVDDFDFYANPTELLAVWRDSLAGLAGNGVVLINRDANFVVDGNSMQFEYRNDTNPKYSETMRTYSSAVDWSYATESVTALEIDFFGDANNGPDPPMYMKLSDDTNTVQVNHDDGNDVTEEWQHTWVIPLKDFTDVNLSNITGIILGIGDGKSEGGAPYEQGTIYFDDVRLYPPRCFPAFAAPYGDFTGDCIIDFSDLMYFAQCWAMLTPLPADCNLCDICPSGGDGTIDFEDFSVFADNWLEEKLWPEP